MSRSPGSGIRTQRVIPFLISIQVLLTSNQNPVSELLLECNKCGKSCAIMLKPPFLTGIISDRSAQKGLFNTVLCVYDSEST
jgi:hypothetical protein